MSLGLLLVSAFSGLITAAGLYFGGHYSFVESVGAYSLTGTMMVLLTSAALFFEGSTDR